jgi:hypothetical protein
MKSFVSVAAHDGWGKKSNMEENQKEAFLSAPVLFAFPHSGTGQTRGFLLELTKGKQWCGGVDER